MRFVETVEGDAGYTVDISYDPEYCGYFLQLVKGGVKMEGYSAFEDNYTEAYKSARELIEVMEKETAK